MNNLYFRMAAALLAAVGASAAFAHDFFLLPENFQTQAAGQVNVQATVSSIFPKPDIVVTADRIGQLYARGAGNPKLTVAGAGTNALNLRLSAPRPGLVVAGVKTLPRDVEYEEDRIGIILEEYNVGPAAMAAVERLPKPRTLRVSSRRFAKTFICAASCGDRSAASQAFGVDLEFVGTRQGGGHFQLLHRGKILPDHPVDVVMADGKRTHIRTDGRGVVHLSADGRGPVMLFAAVMGVPAGNERFTLDLTSLTLSRP